MTFIGGILIGLLLATLVIVIETRYKPGILNRIEKITSKKGEILYIPTLEEESRAEYIRRKEDNNEEVRLEEII